MKHLDPALQKLEQRITPGGLDAMISIGIGVGIVIGGSSADTCDCSSNGTSDCCGSTCD